MASYKDPSFQDRIGRAAEARKKALDMLRSRPPIEEHVLAERRAARLEREAAEAEKRTARKAAESAAKGLKAGDAASETVISAPPTDAQRKALRDARYAARKSRK